VNALDGSTAQNLPIRKWSIRNLHPAKSAKGDFGDSFNPMPVLVQECSRLRKIIVSLGSGLSATIHSEQNADLCHVAGDAQTSSLKTDFLSNFPRSSSFDKTHQSRVKSFCAIHLETKRNLKRTLDAQCAILLYAPSNDWSALSLQDCNNCVSGFMIKQPSPVITSGHR
jgi:hypothetical protein